MQDLFRHLRIHCKTKMEKEEIKICYIHKVAMKAKHHEEPIPFYGIKKWVTYKCPICNTEMIEDEPN